MRLIDADALIAEYDRVHVGAPGGARKLIEDAPTIEPERKTGKWLHTDMNFEDGRDGAPRGWMPWYCSECGMGVGKHQTTYCPYCGAKMGEQENDN